MTKIQALKKIETTLKKSLKELTKDLNKILKDTKVWYCQDDYIKTHEAMHKPTDRNGDQLIIDFATHILNGGELSVENEKYLWTKEDIEK
ncbi:MAG: hypothetical protein J6W16_00475 [Methanobrevibacter sp.]|nr:hypothetical protein [Methanobrevibacter sp.]